MTRIYVAGSWTEQDERARPMIAKVEDSGLVVTHNWTVAEVRRLVDCRCEGFGVPCARCGGTGRRAATDADLTAAERQMRASFDVNGVYAADILWILAPNTDGSCGTWVELGVALGANEARRRDDEYEGKSGRGVHVIVSGPNCRRTIFTEMASHLFETDDEALKYIVDWHRAAQVPG